MTVWIRPSLSIRDLRTLLTQATIREVSLQQKVWKLEERLEGKRKRNK